MSGAKELDAYAVLGVDPAADDESVAAAYRALARRLHPDVAGDGATHQMSVVNAAFDKVRDPKRRREYDDELAEIDPCPGGQSAGAAPRRAGADLHRPHRRHRRRRSPSIIARPRRTTSSTIPPAGTAPAAPDDRQAARPGAC